MRFYYGNTNIIRNFNYPYEAIEEALTNAVYHKSYKTPEPITVVSTFDGITITSIPEPDYSIKDEDRSYFRVFLPIHKDFMQKEKLPPKITFKK